MVDSAEEERVLREQLVLPVIQRPYAGLGMQFGVYRFNQLDLPAHCRRVFN
jgi:hypothetical protein